MSLSRVLEEMKRDIYEVLVTVDRHRDIDQRKILNMFLIDLVEYLRSAGLVKVENGLYEITKEGREALKTLKRELSKE